MIMYIKLFVNGEFADLCATSITSNRANDIINLLHVAITKGAIVDEIVYGDLVIEFGNDQGDLTIDPIGLTPLFNYPMFDRWNHNGFRNTIGPKRLPTSPDLINFVITSLIPTGVTYE